MSQAMTYPGKMSAKREAELRMHFYKKVRTRYKPETMDKIVEAVNDFRTGKRKITDYVNGSERILTWDVMLENWNCLLFLTDETDPDKRSQCLAFLGF